MKKVNDALLLLLTLTAIVTTVGGTLLILQSLGPNLFMLTGFAATDTMYEEEVFTQINFQEFSGASVTLYYTVKDMQGKVIHVEEETLPVSGSLSLSRTLLLTNDNPPGQYTLTIEATSSGKTQVATDTFTLA